MVLRIFFRTSRGVRTWPSASARGTARSKSACPVVAEDGPAHACPHTRAMDAHSSRRVRARLVLTAHEPAEVILQVAVAGLAGLQAEEGLAIRRGGGPGKRSEEQT